MFNLKQSAIGGLAATLLVFPASALAGTEYDWAPVTGVTPVYETVTLVEPYEQCRNERVAYSNGRGSATPPILGAIIGGALGNAVGHKKRNKQVGVVVGALKRTRLLDGDLRVVVPAPRIRRVFEVCDLDRVFKLHKTVQEAVSTA